MIMDVQAMAVRVAAIEEQERLARLRMESMGAHVRLTSLCVPEEGRRRGRACSCIITSLLYQCSCMQRPIRLIGVDG